MCFRSVYARTRNRYLRYSPTTQSATNKEKKEPRRTGVLWKQNDREREGVLWHLWYGNVKGKACLSKFCLSLFLAFIHYLHNPIKQYSLGAYLHLNNGYPVQAWYSPKSKQLVLFSWKEPPKPYCIMGLCSTVTLAFLDPGCSCAVTMRFAIFSLDRCNIPNTGILDVVLQKLKELWN